MKKVPLNDLKEDLSGFAEKVHKGETIEITKYNQPYIRLVPIELQGVIHGQLVGKATLEKGLTHKKNLKNKVLEILLQDRD